MNILGVEAHPDDVEILCSGTLARLGELGHSISILSLTAGELGSVSLNREESIQSRLREAEEAASVIGAKFHCVGIRDKHLFFNQETRSRVSELFRVLNPDIVFAPSPKDYILDHEFTSLLARDAATAASARLFETGATNAVPPTERIPHLYYCEPIAQIDIFGSPVRSSTYVDITDVMETKTRMFACYASQIDWLRARFGMDLLASIREWSGNAGKISSFNYAEGFRQHLAQPFPSDNILVKILGARHLPAS